MNYAVKGSNKVRAGQTAFIVLLTGLLTGAGMYAYAESNKAIPNTTALDNTWRRPAISDNKGRAVSRFPVKSDASQRAANRRYLIKLHDQKRTEALASSNATREQFRSLSDSDKRKFIAMLMLWRIKS